MGKRKIDIVIVDFHDYFKSSIPIVDNISFMVARFI